MILKHRNNKNQKLNKGLNIKLIVNLNLILKHRNNPNQILLGLAGEQATPRHAGGQRGVRQDGPDQREAVPAGRELHGHQRALQLLLHLGDVAEDFGKTARKESRKKLRTSWQQEACLFLG